MLVRIVKLQFKEEKINDFLLHFETVKWEVTNFPGCRGMKLLQDMDTPCLIMTYSVWDDEKTLENYKNSVLLRPFGRILKFGLMPNQKLGVLKQPLMDSNKLSVLMP